MVKLKKYLELLQKMIYLKHMYLLMILDQFLLMMLDMLTIVLDTIYKFLKHDI